MTMKGFLKTIFKIVLCVAFLFFMELSLNAQSGPEPVGPMEPSAPKAPSPEKDKPSSLIPPTKKPDLPYQPKVIEEPPLDKPVGGAKNDDVFMDSNDDEWAPPPKKIEPVIPYFLSKTIEPVGAPDPF